MLPPALRLPAGLRRAAAFALAAGLGCFALCGCSGGPDDPAALLIGRLLQPGDRLLALRVLDPPDVTRVAAVVATSKGKPELRIWERDTGSAWKDVLRESEGDEFKNLSIDDVNGDGRNEILVSWLGGHLEILEILARGDDGAWKPLFQSGGREIEKRYGPTGSLEFWITSRTYDEAPGHPADYATTIYRWTGDRFAEAPRK